MRETTILDTIVEATKIRVENGKKKASLEEVKAKAKVSQNPFTFEKALRTDDIAFICEVKKASPSKGIIAEDFPYINIAKDYEKAGASAISVLTEPDFFMGSDQYLMEVKKAVNIPVIRKDFVVDEYQIYEAGVMGADAVLLICSVLDTATIKQYIDIADQLGLSCLVEAHDAEEVQSALEAGARIIGVNNRNLKTFAVDINNSIELRKLVPPSILFVSESGISTPDDIGALRKNGTNAVLIGESLMRKDNKQQELDRLRRRANG